MKMIFSTVNDHELLDVSGSDAMLLQGAHEQRTKLLLLLLHMDVTFYQANIDSRKYLTIVFHFHSHAQLQIFNIRRPALVPPLQPAVPVA